MLGTRARHMKFGMPGIANAKPIHVLVCTALGQGHYTPAARLSKMLLDPSVATRNEIDVYVTFVPALRTEEAGRALPLAGSEIASARLVEKRVVLEAKPVVQVDLFDQADVLINKIVEALEEGRARSFPPVSAVVHDLFAVHAKLFCDLHQRDTPRYLLSCSSSVVWHVLFGPCHVGDENEGPETVPDIQATSVVSALICGRRRARPLHTETLDISMLWDMLRAGPREPLFDRVPMLSLFQDVSGVLSADVPKLTPFAALQADPSLRSPTSIFSKRVFGLAPFSLRPSRTRTVAAVSSAVRPEQEKSSAEAWLDRQQPRSVVYVAFGSLYCLGKSDLIKLRDALDLLGTGTPVIWAYLSRSRGSGDELSLDELFPKEWQNAHKETWFCTEWVDQIQVLSHPSLRAFATHAGWSSVLESLQHNQSGLPLLCMPLGSEQHVTTILVRDHWKIGDTPFVPKSISVPDWRNLPGGTLLSGTSTCAANTTPAHVSVRAETFAFPETAHALSERLRDMLYTDRYDSLAAAAKQLGCAVRESDPAEVLNQWLSHIETRESEPATLARSRGDNDSHALTGF